MQNKKVSTVVSAKEGDAFWQPGIKGNCITIKVSPWNIAKTNHTVFLHELPKGGEVPEHAHTDQEEIFICLEGEGTIVDGKEFPFKPHDVAFLAPHSKHSLHAATSLKVMVMISPCGLEDRLKLMGIVRKDLNEIPPESFTSKIGKQNSHGII